MGYDLTLLTLTLTLTLSITINPNLTLPIISTDYLRNISLHFYTSDIRILPEALHCIFMNCEPYPCKPLVNDIVNIHECYELQSNPLNITSLYVTLRFM